MSENFTLVLTEFALKLFRRISSGESFFNAVFSPASVTMALAMTYAGTDGITRQEMGREIFGGLEIDEVNEYSKKFAEFVATASQPPCTETYDQCHADGEEGDGNLLVTANRIYVEKSYEILQSYLDTLLKFYESGCLQADFAENVEHSRQEINKWVEDISREKIRDLLPSGIIYELTRMVLINVIYFKGSWLKPFHECNTEMKSFYAMDETRSAGNLHTMHATLKQVKFATHENCKILGLPYQRVDESEELTMYFFLPTETSGLPEFEKDLTAGTFWDLIDSVHPDEVKILIERIYSEDAVSKGVQNVLQIQLPKFTIEQSNNLVTILKDIGISTMFNSMTADFSGISDNTEGLFVSSIIHKAFFDMNEKGSEASAATALSISKRCASVPSEPKEFVADHPFLFAIVIKNIKSILFLGHFYGS